MDLYPLVRPLLFRLDAERAHHLTLGALRLGSGLRLPVPGTGRRVDDPVEVMGLQFPNRVGLAAGMDKAADCVYGFGTLGFGHVEVGTLTPRPQPGNPAPRLFRLPEHGAIINRMGFNNPGIEAGMHNLAQSREGFRGVVGVNIGKNFDTPNERAADDYLAALRTAFPHADYIAVNLSSPNTKGLRELQGAEAFGGLLRTLKAERDRLVEELGNGGRPVPLAVKLAPDMEEDQLSALAALIAEIGLDAVIATNTTIDRAAVAGHPRAEEAGGLSGAPVRERSTWAIEVLHRELGNAVPIIGVGGISCGADAEEKILAGAQLVQLYTGLVYRGPSLPNEVARALKV